MTWRTDVVDSGVNRLHAGLANVADLETSLSALVRSSDRAATSAEVALSALSSRLCEARGAAVVARSTLGALTNISQTITVTICTVRTEELRREAGPVRAVAARGTLQRRGGVVQAVRTRGTGL